MSKADSLDRRSLLAAAGGIAAAGALGSLPALASEGPSPEFREYLRLRAAFIAHCELEPKAEEFDSPVYKAWDAANHDACWACGRASDVIRDRPVRSERDFRELVRVVQEELWMRRPSDGSWEQHSGNEKLEEAMMRALFQRIKGGAHA